MAVGIQPAQPILAQALTPAPTLDSTRATTTTDTPAITGVTIQHTVVMVVMVVMAITAGLAAAGL
ncbi:MAG: hypothetical protein AABZ53_00600, partial [Planctomycetota bacterium]